jgi:hypothetical protein
MVMRVEIEGLEVAANGKVIQPQGVTLVVHDLNIQWRHLDKFLGTIMPIGNKDGGYWQFPVRFVNLTVLPAEYLEESMDASNTSIVCEATTVEDLCDGPEL